MRCYIILRDFLNALYTEIMSGEPTNRTNNVELIMYISMMYILSKIPQTFCILL